MNNIFIDSEFDDTGSEIRLISIALVKETGEEYYAELKNGWYPDYINEWVAVNVLPVLTYSPDVLKYREEVAKEIIEFVGDNPTFWGYYSSYDWIVLCQLYGCMV